MFGTSSSSVNTSHAPALVQTTANAMAKTPVFQGGNLLDNDPSIIQSTSELMELSTGPNAQIVHHEDEGYTRMPLDADDDEMFQKLPKRKRFGNGWTKIKKGSKATSASRSTIPTAAAVPAEVDPSKEEWAANLRRVVFEPSTVAEKKPSKTAQKPSNAPLTQSSAHVMYFPRTAVVDNGKEFELRAKNQNRTDTVTRPLRDGARLGGQTDSRST